MTESTNDNPEPFCFQTGGADSDPVAEKPRAGWVFDPAGNRVAPAASDPCYRDFYISEQFDMRSLRTGSAQKEIQLVRITMARRLTNFKTGFVEARIFRHDDCPDGLHSLRALFAHSDLQE